MSRPILLLTLASLLAPSAALAQGADTDGDGVLDAADAAPADPRVSAVT
jgi:hypothetical protein